MKIQHESGISAECIAASIYEGGPPIYTVVTRAPKSIDAEFEKHRMLSSNSSSSRAIPVEKIIKQVEEDPWLPLDWRYAQKGMQGDKHIIGAELRACQSRWLDARKDAIDAAKALLEIGAHKQVINRILESWIWQHKVITGTEWENFFNLRCHPAADPAMQTLANCIKEAIETAEPVDRSDGSWHLPFILPNERKVYLDNDNRMVSAARVARISYSNHGTEKIDRYCDLVLADSLKSQRHLTPFEAQARKLKAEDRSCYYRDGAHWSANFRGWLQYRKEIE